MQDYDIEAGDRVTYKYKGESDIFTRIITINSDAEITLKDDKEILKIERIGSNNWDTVYEKEKDLLTEEEREFLQQAIEFANYGNKKNEKVKYIKQSGYFIYFHFSPHYSNSIYIDKDIYFRGLTEDEQYSLSELGLYEGE